MNINTKISWLVRLLLSYKGLRFREIQKHWMENYSVNSTHKPLPKRTFDGWREKALELFGAIIEYDSHTRLWDITNRDSLRFDHIHKCLLDDEETEKKTSSEEVRIHVSELQSKYFRKQPLHPSQKASRQKDGSCIFTYYLHPTIDFQQKIMSYGSEVEVLSPTSLREKIICEVRKMLTKYEQ